MRGFLDACYALVVGELAGQGVAPGDVLAEVERTLMEPHPDEVSAEALERARRRRIAEENRAATERLAAMSGMPLSRSMG